MIDKDGKTHIYSILSEDNAFDMSEAPYNTPKQCDEEISFGPFQQFMKLIEESIVPDIGIEMPPKKRRRLNPENE